MIVILEIIHLMIQAIVQPIQTAAINPQIIQPMMKNIINQKDKDCADFMHTFCL